MIKPLLGIAMLIAGTAGAAPIHDAVLGGDAARVEAILKQDPSAINAVDEAGLTPLHYAAKSGRIELVKLLLAHHAKVNPMSADGETPYFMAEMRQPDIARLLDEHGGTDAGSIGPEAVEASKAGDLQALSELLRQDPASANSKDGDGFSALHWAVDKPTVELLLSKGADPNVSNAGGATPLMVAARKGRADIVASLIKHRADVAAVTSTGWTALHNAANAGHEDVVRLLLSSGADPNCRDKDGLTPLHKAAIWNRATIVGPLAAAKAEVNAKNAKGETPLDLAYFSNLEVAEALRAHGGKGTPRTHEIYAAVRASDLPTVKRLLKKDKTIANLKDENDNVPLTWVKDAATAEVLFAAGADPNVVNRYGMTPLHHAAQSGTIEIVKLLLAHKADVHVLLGDKPTALHLAVKKGNGDIVDALLAAGADLEARESGGSTALHAAVYSGSTRRIVESLLAKGADVNARDNLGSTPLHLVANHDYKIELPGVTQTTEQTAVGIVYLLADHGADLLAKNSKDVTPIQAARNRGNAAIARAILERMDPVSRREAGRPRRERPRPPN